MELWIRSQNKEILQKTNALFIAHSEENVWSIIDNQNMTKYGTYKTYERALQILDEIQNHLLKMGDNEILTDKIGIMNGIKHYGIVYEMPKE